MVMKEKVQGAEKRKDVSDVRRAFGESRFFRIICILQVIVLIVLLIQCVCKPVHLMFSGDALIPMGENTGARHVSDDGEVYYAFQNDEPTEETIVLETERFKLGFGAYDVRVRYASDRFDTEELSTAVGTGKLSFARYSSFYHFDDLLLRDAYTQEKQSVRITSPLPMKYLRLNIRYGGCGTLIVHEIEIVEYKAFKYILLFLAAGIFALMNLFIVRALLGKLSLTWGLLLLVCLAAALPFAGDYVYEGHDLPFHLNRIVCLADEIRLGNFFPMIYGSALGGYGYANPLFYMHFFLYIPALLYANGFSLSAAYNAYIVLFSVATCLIMYGTARKIFKKEKTAVLCAALYTLSAVRLTNVLTRAAVGEWTAQTFLPLVVLGFYEIYSAKRGEKIGFGKIMPLIIGLTCIFFSHMLSTVMCVMLIFVFCAANCKKTLEKERFFALLRAACITLLLCMGLLVRFVNSYSMNLALKAKTNYIQATGTYPIQLFSVIVNNYQRDQYAGTAMNEMSLAVGLPIVLGLGLCVYVLVKRRLMERDRLFGFAKVCLFLSVATLFLSSIYVPYDALDRLPDFLYSVLTVYQFSWRWLVFATLFGVFAAAYALDNVNAVIENKRISFAAIFAVVTALVLNMGQIYADQLATSNMYVAPNNVYAHSYNLGEKEYMLLSTYWDPNKARLQDVSLVYDDAQLEVSGYERIKNGVKFDVHSRSDETETVFLPLMSYDNYCAYDKSGQRLVLWPSNKDKVSVDIPPMYEGGVRVAYRMPVRWRIAFAISHLTILSMGLYGVLFVRKRRKNRQSDGHM